MDNQSQKVLVIQGILKNICGMHSMRQMDENFNEENCIETLRIVSGTRKLEEMPHYDTLNYYLERLDTEELSKLRKKMTAKLIGGIEWVRLNPVGIRELSTVIG